MLKANLCRISYIPVFSIYAAIPLIHDVMPNHNGYYSEDWIALAGMYALGALISLPLFYLLKKRIRAAAVFQSPRSFHACLGQF